VYLSREQVRQLDQRAVAEYGVPGVVLMENAGRGAADVLVDLGVQGPVVVCCGKGNNAGDGFVLARHLDLRHVGVRVVLLAAPESLVGDAAVNYRIIECAGLPIVRARADAGDEDWSSEFRGADWVVDALFGTGLVGPVRRPFEAAIAAINACGARILALDIPSGLDCDSGEPLGATVRATHTVTFVAHKKGFANARAREWLGEVHVADIGAPRRLTDSYGTATA
jgi:NAD(P)H-hydrate epimerase